MPIFMKLQVHHVASIDCRTGSIQNSKSVKMELSLFLEAGTIGETQGHRIVQHSIVLQDCHNIITRVLRVEKSLSKIDFHHINTTFLCPAKWASCLRHPSVLLPSVQNGSWVSPAKSLAEGNSPCCVSLQKLLTLCLVVEGVLLQMVAVQLAWAFDRRENIKGSMSKRFGLNTFWSVVPLYCSQKWDFEKTWSPCWKAFPPRWNLQHYRLLAPGIPGKIRH